MSTSIRQLHVAADEARAAWDKAAGLLDSARTRENKDAFATAEANLETALMAVHQARASLYEAAWDYQDDQCAANYDALIAAALAAHATDTEPLDRRTPTPKDRH